MIDLPVGLMLAAIGLLCGAALVRSLATGRLAVFYSKRPDIDRAEEPLRFWTQFTAVGLVGALALFLAALMLS
jgi:hypothetical protein